MHGTTLPALTGQAATRSNLAEAIRQAHAVVVNALGVAVEHAIKCGNILTDAKKQVGHGGWLEFLRACDLGERQAQRYMRLALLAEQTRLAKSDLTGMTIEGAIARLAPPKAPKPTTSPKPAIASKQIAGPRPSTGGKPTKHVDIIEAWLNASAADRAKAIDSIGLKDLLAAIPENWWALIEKRLAERNAPPPPRKVDPALLPADGSIPPCLLRRKAKKPRPQDVVAASAEAMKEKFAALDAGAA
jgi:hypothetical protein